MRNTLFSTNLAGVDADTFAQIYIRRRTHTHSTIIHVHCTESNTILPLHEHIVSDFDISHSV